MWIITAGSQATIDEKHLVGTCSVNFDQDKFNARTQYPFRILDGDGVVYCFGLSDNDSSFAPLDDFGRGNWGCETIEYLENGAYRPL